FESPDAASSAAALDAITKSVEETRTALEAGLKKTDEKNETSTVKPDSKPKPKPRVISKVLAARAVRRLDDLQGALKEWFEAFDGYDPTFGWWNREPHKQLTEALSNYKKFLREKIMGIDPKAKEEPIIG